MVSPNSPRYGVPEFEISCSHRSQGNTPKRFFGVPSFFNYAIADGIYNLLYPDKTALKGLKPKNIDDFQLSMSFG
jgi:hypothetical protein